MADFLKDFALGESPIYKARNEQWKFQEAVYRGGKQVRDLILPFYWEKLFDTQHLVDRRRIASHVPFGRRMAERFVGTLSAEAPQPGEGLSFGSMGEVRPEEDYSYPPKTFAELMWLNADRRGSDWTSFWNENQRRSVVTGHRWIGVEAPILEAGKAVKLDEALIRGVRPYLVGISPLQIPNHFYKDGRLVALSIRKQVRRLVVDGTYKGSDLVEEYVVYIAEGYADLGEEYAGGGFWIVDEQGNKVTGADGKPITGDLKSTLGEIPYTPLFYALDDEEMSRSGTEEIAAIEVAYMNLSSAGDNDALEGGSRTQHILGTRVEEFNKAVALKQQGSRMIPWEPTETINGPVIPEIWDSASVTASSSIEMALERKRKEAAIIAADEIQAGPQASGEARYIEFMDVKLPRLSLMAVHRQSAEQRVLNFAEMRFGATSGEASVIWNKRFNMESTPEAWERIFTALGTTGAQSPTLVFTGVRSLLQNEAVRLPKEDLEKIRTELEASLSTLTQSVDDRLIPDDPDDDEEPPPNPAPENDPDTSGAGD